MNDGLCFSTVIDIKDMYMYIMGFVIWSPMILSVLMIPQGIMKTKWKLQQRTKRELFQVNNKAGGGHIEEHSFFQQTFIEC